MTDRKSGRNTDGTFAAGNPGKPRGTRHKATRAALALLDGEAEALTRQQYTPCGAPVASRAASLRITPIRNISEGPGGGGRSKAADAQKRGPVATCICAECKTKRGYPPFPFLGLRAFAGFLPSPGTGAGVSVSCG